MLGVPNSSPANNNALAGVMIRNDLTAGSAQALMAMSPGSVNGAVFKYRTTAGGSASTANAAGVWNPYWVRLTRVGNLFTAYRSADGVTWTQVGTAQTITMGTSVYIGLAVTAADNNQLNISTFDNVNVQVSQAVTGSLVAAPDVTWRDLGKKSYDLVVHYSSSEVLDASSVNGDEIQVSGPSGLLPVRLLGINLASNGKSLDATYRLTPPGGSWSSDDNGSYTIALLPGTVADVANNTNAAASLGPIPVSLPGPSALALVINGTPNADTISITLTDSGYTRSVNGIGFSYAGSSVRSILVGGLAGNDRITINGEIYICEVSAGAGNDTVEGGSGDDLIRGDEDNDVITGNLGEDTLYGNFGNDSMTGAEGADSIMGGLARIPSMAV